MEIRPILSALLRSKTGAVLVAAQVALTLAIVSNALFVVQERLSTASRPTGADDADVFQIFYVAAGEVDDPKSMMQRDLETLRAIPGVVAAAPTNQVPLGHSGWGLDLTLDPSKPASSVVGAAYFGASELPDALGLEIALGRGFEESDVREIDARTEELEADVVLLTRHMARALFDDEASAVGQTVYLGSGTDAKPMRVIGIIDRLTTPFAPTSDAAYRSFVLPVRYLSDAAHYVVRAEPGERARIMAEAEKALTALRSDRVLIHHRSMDEIRERRYRNEKAGAGMLVAVTVGLLVVTASGIVGIASLWVTQRRKQIGVRRALGARRLDILRYFVAENLIITTGGVIAGVVLSIGLNQLLVTQVELSRLPLVYVLAGVAVSWVLGVAAVLGPAWRAATVPPAIATRSA